MDSLTPNQTVPQSKPTAFSRLWRRLIIIGLGIAIALLGYYVPLSSTSLSQSSQTVYYGYPLTIQFRTITSGTSFFDFGATGTSSVNLFVLAINALLLIATFLLVEYMVQKHSKFWYFALPTLLIILYVVGRISAQSMMGVIA